MSRRFLPSTSHFFLTWGRLLTCFATVGLVGATGLGVTKAAAATESLKVSLSPPVTYLMVKPGENQTYTLNLENQSPTALDVTPSLLDFSPDNQTGQPQLKNSTAFNYLTLNNDAMKLGEKFRLESQQKINIPITITTPPSASEAEYPMTIFFTFEIPDPTATAATQAQVAGTIGSNLIVYITRNESDRGKLQFKNLKTWPLIDSLMPLKFTALAENVGKNATVASGSATILDWRNQEVAQFEIHPDMILAGSSRELRDQTTLSPVFRYDPPFLLGLYQIKIEVATNSRIDAEPTTIIRTVVAAPFLVILLPAIGLALYSGYGVILKNKPRRNLGQNEKNPLE